MLGLPSADEGHLGRHDGHGEDVGRERQVRHVDDGVADVLVGDATYTPLQYREPDREDLPDGQASDVTAWRDSVHRLRSLTGRVHFCHDTAIVHA